MATTMARPIRISSKCVEKIRHRWQPNNIREVYRKRKSLAQEVRQKSDYFVCNTAAGLLCKLSRIILHQKWIKPFLSEINCRIFFYSLSFSKKADFSEKIVKNCSGGAYDNFFRERRRFAPKINITLFITNKVPNNLLFSSFFKKGCIFWENGKTTISRAQVSFGREEDVRRRKWI